MRPEEQALVQFAPAKSRQKILSGELREKIDYWLSLFPPQQRRSAVISALREAQHLNGGGLTTELMDSIAEYLELPPIAVYEVASFYSMFTTRKVGRRCIAVCTNLSCMLKGSDEIVHHIERRLRIKTGDSTPDGRYYLKCEEECLAACSNAPMMQIDHKYYTDLTPDKVDQILDLDDQN